MTDNNLRLVFAGTPDFAAGPLETLLAAGFNIIAVYTQPDRPAGRGKKILPTPVKKVAEAHDIPVFQPDRLDPEEVARLTGLAPDVLVVVAYGHILNRQVLDIPRLGCINVHASLLPRWRGAAPIERAILAGDSETGISIMQMDEGLDTGKVLLQLITPITAEDNSGTVTARLMELGARGLVQVLPALSEYQSGAREQDDSLATYAGKLGKEESSIHWEQPARAIRHQVQALYPRAPAWCLYRNERLRIITALEVEHKIDAAPGTVLETDESGLLVACGEDALKITRLQLPGKTPASLKEIINGHPGFCPPGELLLSAENA